MKIWYNKLSKINKFVVATTVIMVACAVCGILMQVLKRSESQIYSGQEVKGDNNQIIQSGRDVVIHNPVKIIEQAIKPQKDVGSYQSPKKQIQKSDTASITIGSNSVVSINQQGGQTAGTIQNNIIVNPTKRIIPQNVFQNVAAELEKCKGRKDSIIIANNDLQGSETTRFAENLNSLFEKAGWKSTIVNLRNTIANGTTPTGMFIYPKGSDNIKIAEYLYREMASLGYEVYVKRMMRDMNDADLIIQIWTK